MAAAKPVPAQISASAAKSPERRNAITRKAAKKISAAPKSLISTRQPQMNAEYAMNSTRLRRETTRSSVEAPTNTKQTFTSSEGWNESGPIMIQFRAPYCSVPNTRLNSSSATPITAAA